VQALFRALAPYQPTGQPGQQQHTFPGYQVGMGQEQNPGYGSQDCPASV
jgi:hypothetical protein